MKYQIHKLNEDDILRIEKKAEISLDSFYTENTYCLVDAKKGKEVALDDNGVLTLFQAKKVKDTAAGAVYGLAQAYAYFTDRGFTVKDVSLDDALDPEESKLKGLSKIKRVETVCFPDAVLDKMSAVKDEIKLFLKGLNKSFAKTAEVLQTLPEEVAELPMETHSASLQTPGYLLDEPEEEYEKEIDEEGEYEEDEDEYDEEEDDEYDEEEADEERE